MSRQQEWQNGSFEEFIRQKADEGQPVEFNPAAWESMAEMLDRHLPAGNSSTGHGKGYGGLLAALLITGLMGWYLYYFSTSNNHTERVHVQEQAAAEQTAPTGAHETEKETLPNSRKSRAVDAPEKTASQPEGTGSHNKTAVNTTPPAIADVTSGSGSMGGSTITEAVDDKQDPKRAKAAADHNPGMAEGAGEKNRNSREAAAERETENTFPAGLAPELLLKENAAESNLDNASSKWGAAAEKAGTDAALPQANSPAQSSRPAGESGAGILISASDDGQQEAAVQQQQQFALPLLVKKTWMPLALTAAAVSAPLPGLAEMPKATIENVAESVVKKQRSQSPVSISLTVAPDFTGTGQAGSVKPGAGAGLYLEYFLWERLSVVTGAFYSKKNYEAGGGFSPYGEPWHYGHAPDYIDASCGVIDIPLNLRYYLLEGNRQRFFISSGASSYLMRSEDYRMVYNDYYYEDYTYALRNENRHFMAVWNLSLGFEHALSQRWSLQAEPFLKIPVRGVGSGAAKLNSMGALIHLKYNFMRPGSR